MCALYIFTLLNAIFGNTDALSTQVEGRIPRKLKKGILRKAAKRDPKPKPDGRTAAAKAKASKKGKTFKA